MSETGSTPAAWHPDPFARFELRYWDGSTWTEHVSTGGVQSTDPAVATPAAPGVPVGTDTAEKIQKQVGKQAGLEVGAVQGGGSLFTEPILVVNQKAKLIEISNEYAIHDQHGNQIGAVREVGQSAAKKAIRVLTSYDQFLSHKLEVVDMGGQVVLALHRPAKLMKSKIIVSDGTGREIGTIIQKNVLGKIRFALDSGGQTVGWIKAENWRAWNFSIQDHTETEVARITKTFEGLAKAIFTTADNYVVQMHAPLTEPLLHMVVAAAVSVDTALKQDSQGFN